MRRLSLALQSLIALPLVVIMLVACAPDPAEESTIPASTLVGAPATSQPPSIATAVASTPIMPTPRPTRQPPEQLSRTYTVQHGDTMTSIAAVFDTSVEELMQVNGLTDPNQLTVGQILQIPMKVTVAGPDKLLIPDSELVYSPAFVNFDVETATASYTGWFNTYTELMANGETLTGPEIVELVSTQYSVGPRVLLALLELQGEWLTNPDPSPQARLYPLGYVRDGWDGLAAQLMWAADTLNSGFYGWLHEDLWTAPLSDGTHLQFALTLNSGTVGLQRLMVVDADYETLKQRLLAFDEVYRRLWGDPFVYAIEPLLPTDATAPTLALPWSQGETWYYTGGPHGGWGDGSAWAALDFATSEQNLGCTPSRMWVTAVAPGLIVVSDEGMVLQDLDSDGFPGTGWVLLYMHMAAEGRVGAGSSVSTGDRIGHPSCEGGFSNASHLHIARRFNGVWIAAEHPQWPLVLGGWRAHNGGRPYDGTLSKGEILKTAEEDWVPANAILH
ncbi:MAG: LysM peptidoglycan-binding domain-containing protein [Anaerolineae bacterium]